MRAIIVNIVGLDNAWCSGSGTEVAVGCHACKERAMKDTVAFYSRFDRTISK